MKKRIALSFCVSLCLFLLFGCQIPFINNGEPSDSTNDNNNNNATQTPTQCTVSFNTDAGYDIDSQTVKYNETATKPYDPSKKGCRFDGWYYDDIKWDFQNTKVKKDITLTAKWNYIQYDITYDLGGGSYQGEMPSTYTVATPTITFGTPSREGYEFVGWTINGTELNEIKMGTTGKKEIKAIWYGLEAVVLPAKDGASGIVCFIHDDARLPTMEIMDGLLEKHGLVGDVGFLLSKVYNGSTVNTAEVEKYRVYLENGRWKIVNHSATHNWWGKEIINEFGMTSIIDDEDKREYELITSQKMMRQLYPNQRVLTFAYPGFSAVVNKYTDGSVNQMKQYIYTPEARRLIETHHIAARFYNGGPTTIGEETDWNWMKTSFLSASFIENSLPTLLANSVKNNTINVLSLHAVTDDPEVYNSDPGYYLMADKFDLAMAMVSSYVEKGQIWNTNYEDAILYLREAETAKIAINKDGDIIKLTLTDEMDDEIYNAPVTVRINNFGDAEAFRLEYNGETQYIKVKTVNDEAVLDFNIVPDKGEAILTPVSLDEIPES